MSLVSLIVVVCVPLESPTTMCRSQLVDRSLFQMFERHMSLETSVAMVLRVHDEKLSLGCKMLQVRLVKDPNDLMCIYVFCSVQAS